LALQARVGRLEIFDELEEWEVIMRHYCLVYAWRGSAIAQGLPRAL
jgi:[phosphatase 2A protein]-leucine-carboxy methyltransferase